MKKFTEYLLVSSLLLGAAGSAGAQEKSAEARMPPRIINILREYLKPGKAGSLHEKTESAFVKVMRSAKWPTHYLGMDSISGKPRSLFITPYDSFADLQKDNLAEQDNDALADALDRAGIADGELQSEADSSDFAFREDYSLRPAVEIAHMRYFDITVYRVRQGHDKEWDALVKLYISGYEKIPDSHWTTYEAIYGQDAGTFLVFVPMKSLAEVDRGLSEQKQFESSLGEDGMKKLAELTAAAVESSHSNLFAFNPRISYASDEWIKADPHFWKTKAVPAATSKKSEKKPAAKE